MIILMILMCMCMFGVFSKERNEKGGRLLTKKASTFFVTGSYFLWDHRCSLSASMDHFQLC